MVCKLNAVLKLMIYCGLYWEEPGTNNYVKYAKTMQVQPLPPENIEKNKLHLNLAKIWSFLLLTIPIIGAFVYSGTLAYYTFDDNDSDLIRFLGNIFWNICFSSVSIFLIIWIFFKNAHLRRLVQRARAFAKEYNFDLLWKSNLYTLYMISVGFAICASISDLLFTRFQCTLDSSQCNFITLVLTIMWGRFLFADIGISLFFWCITSILSESLLCCIQRLVSSSKTLSKTAFMNDYFLNLEEKIVFIFEVIDDLMQFLGWPMLIRCLYDMSSTAIAMYFFIDFALNKQVTAINVVLVYCWRGFGILAHASSADSFNNTVSK